MIKLSVIIPTRNRAALLKCTLDSIVKQTIDQSLFEVIICDNNSTDDTGEISHIFAHKFLNFRYEKTIEPGLHVGRNKGFLESKGDILVYIDDDIEALPEWLYTINEAFNDEDVVLVGGKNLPKWEIPPPDWALQMWAPNQHGERVCGYFSIIDLGNEIKATDPYNVYGCNFSVKKSIINETKGFHPDGMPQEMIKYRGDGESAVSEYIKQNGYKTIYHPMASVFHLVSNERLTIDYLRKRGFNQGVSDSYTTIRTPKLASSKRIFIFKSTLKKVLYGILNFCKTKPQETVNDFSVWYKAIDDGHRKGFNFHQQKVKESPELKAWVMKDNYL